MTVIDPQPSELPVRLRPVHEEDLSTFFEHQLDPEANHMAAFTAKDPTDREAFSAQWTKVLGDESISKKTILFEDRVVGSIVGFERLGNREIAYWIGREFWSRGIATAAVQEFLSSIPTRPLFARAAKDNIASLRVLKKCGFIVSGEDKGFANARGEETEEYILKLAASIDSEEQ